MNDRRFSSSKGPKPMTKKKSARRTGSFKPQEETHQSKRDRHSDERLPQNTTHSDRHIEPAQEQEEADFIYGKHAALEFIHSGDPRTVNKIFLQKGLRGEIATEAHHFAETQKLVLQEVPKAKLDQLTADANHQGILLTLSPYQYHTIQELLDKAAEANEEPLLLILDNLNDPHNLGSILRTADAIGAHGVIIPKRRAVGITGVVAKTAAGALEHVLVSRVTNLAATIDELKEKGVWIFGTAMSGEDYRQWNSRGPIALVIGNEGKGISTLVAKKVDGMVTIPMIGHVQSLNASVATSILLYHIFDQRHPLEP